MKLLKLILTAAIIFTSVLSVQNAIADDFNVDLISNNSKSSIIDFSYQNKVIPASEAFQLNYTLDENQVSLSWEVKPGYYLYLDKIKFNSNHFQIGNAVFPPAKIHDDPNFGKVAVLDGFISAELPFKNTGLGGNVEITYQGCASAGLCYPPETVSIEVPQSNVTLNSVKSVAVQNSDEIVENEEKSIMDFANKKSIFITLSLVFVLGLGLSLTPCVFPMYPILSGIIAGQGHSLSVKKGLALSFSYVQGMAITFTLLGLVVASAGMKYQAALQQPAVIISTAILFFILALSMFGLFQFQAPAFLQSRLTGVSNAQKSGSYAGSFIMGAISGLISSPCTTAPLSGVLLYVAQSGDLLVGGATLYVLSIGMSVPLLIIGAGGGKLLPKAGSWMNKVKIFFGIALLGVSLVMLGRVYSQAAVLFIALDVLIVCCLIYGLYKKRLQLNKIQKFLTVTVVSILLFIFAYLQAAYVKSETGTHLSSGITTIEQLQERLSDIKDKNKPVVIDLYADWCTACLEMDKNTFSDPVVRERLNEMVFLRIDMTANSKENQKILSHFNVLGLPAIILIDNKGNELKSKRISGYLGPKAFTDRLNRL